MVVSAETRRVPPAHPIWGHSDGLNRDQIGYMTWLAKEYGDVVPLWLPPYRSVFFNRADLIEQVLSTKHRSFRKSIVQRRMNEMLGEGLLSSEGARWQRQRRLVLPAFHRERIEAYGQTMVEQAEGHVREWRDGEVRDAQQEMMSLTLGIVCKTMFGVDVSEEAGELGRAFTAALHGIHDRTASLQIVLPGSVPTPARIRLWFAVRRLNRLVYRIIREHRRGGDRGDLVSMLLAARDEHGGAAMSDREVRDQLMTIALAGHETTALALSWGWYLLAQAPEAEARLHAELAEVLGGRSPTLADLPLLTYTGMVVSEALRLYPPAWALARQAAEDVEIGDYLVRKGTFVMVSQWTIQRDARYFDRPDAFEPERWADGLAKRLPRFAYFPFGGGPRQCIGSGFALMEASLLLATIAQRYRLEVLPGQEIVPEPTITARAKHGIRMRLHARQG
jgi:cytochrome P450